MHPEFIRALGREREAELLRHQHFRDTRSRRAIRRIQKNSAVLVAVPSAAPVARRPVDHLRRSLGSALVTAGTRLLARRPPGADWAAPEADRMVGASRHGTSVH
jgi:hypothetical protein